MTTLSTPSRTTTRTTKRARPPRRVAALHAQGDAWRMVIAEANGAMRMIACESLRAGDASSVRELLDRHDVPLLVRLIPAGDALVRVPDVPEEVMQGEASFDEALALLAESELPMNVPAHRRAAGVLVAPGTAMHTPVIVGWPVRAGETLEVIDAERERWTSELVPLMALAAMGKHESSGAAVAAYACAEASSIGMVGLNGSRTAMRGIPEPGADMHTFAARARSAYAELCARMGTADHDAMWPSASRRLTVDAAASAGLAKQLSGAQATTDWCDRYGLAAAAAVAALSSHTGTQQLFTLQAAEPRNTQGRFDRMLASLATTQGAIVTIGVSIAMVLLISLGAAWGRAALLESRASRLQEALTQVGQENISVEDQLAVYGELDRIRWPMTKLLADLTAAMPAESPSNLMLADAIELQAGEAFLVRGTADSLDLVNRFVAALNGSGVFDGADIRRYEAVGAGVRIEFEVEGSIVRPFGTARSLHDYSGTRTVANRIYGIEDDPMPGESSTDTDAAPSASSSVSSESNGQAAPTFDGGEKRGAGRSQEDIPEPLTDEEIAAFTQQEAMAEYSKRRSLGRSRTDLTAEVKQRLLDEADKCRARAVEAKKEGGS